MNMFDRSRFICACLAIALGVLHILYVIITIKAFTPYLILFSSAGFAMILAGHANLDKARLLPSFLMLIFFVFTLVKLPLPQVFFGTALFAWLSFAALAARKLRYA